MIGIIILAGLFVGLCATLALYRFVNQRLILRNSRRIVSEGGISSVEGVILGGIRQHILIQAVQSGKPVLLVLHGGPALPVPGVACRGVDWVFNLSTEELRKHFTVVFWDQRGTGKSYSPNIPQTSIHMEQFVSDALELTDWLRRRFGEDKIFLSGASWGSILGLKLAARYPDRFHAYFGIAQIVNWAESDRDAYWWLLQQASKRNNGKAHAELKSMGEPPYLNDLSRWNNLRKWLMLLGGFIYKDENVKHPGMAAMFKMLLLSPDYKLSDTMRSFSKGMKLSYSSRMMEDIANYDAFAEVRKLELPVYFFHGRHDQAISGTLLQQFYDELEALEGKHLTWLEQSAHIYCPADSKIVEQQMIRFAKHLELGRVGEDRGRVQRMEVVG